MNNDGINKSGRKVTNPKGNLANLTGMGKGRPKGVPNKFSQSIKDQILAALDKLGGIAYLVRLGNEQPAVFCSLLGRVLPLQITGSNGGPINVVVNTGVFRHGDAECEALPPTIEARIETVPAPPPPEPPPISRIPSFAPAPGPQAPRAPGRPHPRPDAHTPATPAATPANQLVGARTAETENGARVRTLLAPWS